jgi:hypothetical protein
MRLGAVLFAAGLAAAALTGWADDAPPVRFAAVFRDTTMRVDYFHTWDAGRETFALDRIVSDGRWAGSRTILLDSLNLGTWRFTVLDSATGEARYLQATPRSTPSGDHQSGQRRRLRVARVWPETPVRVVLERRDRECR